jgi:hypothetical protein
MMSSRFFRTALVVAGAIVLGMVLGPVLSGVVGRLLPAAAPQPVQAQAGEPQTALLLSPDSPDDVYDCIPFNVGVFSNRVHVRCTVAAPGGVYYFAAPTSDSKYAARVLSLMLTAKATGKTVRFYYNPSDSGASYGCSYSDCRPFWGIEVLN